MERMHARVVYLSNIIMTDNQKRKPIKTLLYICKRSVSILSQEMKILQTQTQKNKTEHYNHPSEQQRALYRICCWDGGYRPLASSHPLILTAPLSQELSVWYCSIYNPHFSYVVCTSRLNCRLTFLFCLLHQFRHITLVS